MTYRIGSSPLARGLLAPETTQLTISRIIPARAGFTARPTRRSPVLSDHPRSRGVYGLNGRLAQADQGSSPLARGLPIVKRRVITNCGIIPARAGFTRARRVSGRGVGVVGVHSLVSWIIPARAGFTMTLRSTYGRTKDHPRSRGVYLTEK